MNTESQDFPALYLSHGGGPCFFMDWSPIGPDDTWKKMETWLARAPETLPLPHAPKAIILISAHWEEAEFTIQKVARPNLIFDYYGFPPHTYELKYPAPGSVELADQIKSQLETSGIRSNFDESRGFDHGVFIPLLLMFPKADVPIVQISLKSNLDPAEHLALGRALSQFRSQGILLIGSGMSYHNLRALFSGAETAPGSDEFDAWLTETVTASDPKVRNQSLIEWKTAPSARLAHPRAEHLMPLMVVAGAAMNDTGKLEFTDKIMGAKTSTYSF
jgi:aromatic ring-opening dioxygenase catalytic subunit (LigB family)